MAKIFSEQELNELGAKMMRAELMGNEVIIIVSAVKIYMYLRFMRSQGRVFSVIHVHVYHVHPNDTPCM